MIGFLAYGPDRNIVGIPVMAGFALSRDPHVTKVRRWLERRGGTVADIAILAGRQMGSWFAVECVSRRAEVTIMAGRAVVGIYAHVVERRDRKVRMHNTQSTVAIGAILVRTERRRKVIKELSDTDHIVVAVRAKRGGINVNRPVVKDAGCEST